MRIKLETNTKKCGTCKLVLNISEFCKNKTKSDGINVICKECDKIAYDKYRKTINGLINGIYKSQKKHSLKRGHELPSYTKEEFKKWILEQSNFEKLYKNWVESGYNKDLTPSIDRLDDYKSYSFENIILTTWNLNKEKGHEDRKKGVNNKVSKNVMQFDLDNNYIKEYPSISIAARELGLDSSTNIAKCCRGELKTSSKFKWKFSNNKNQNICLV